MSARALTWARKTILYLMLCAVGVSLEWWLLSHHWRIFLALVVTASVGVIFAYNYIFGKGER